MSPVWPMIRPRRIHVFCVGAPKTGTKSIAEMFRGSFRAFHEPGIDRVVDALSALRNDSWTESRIRRFLKEHDRRFWLEVESSHPISEFSQYLAEMYPDARFILTIRDCYSWLESMINQHIKSFSDPKLPPYWPRVNDIYYGNGAGFEKGDRVLSDLGLYSLDAYLSYWSRQIRTVIENVPADRLFIVRTDRLSDALGSIAEFTHIDVDLLHAERRHSHKAPAKRRIVSRIDPGYLEEKIDEHCRPLLAEFFPDIITR